METLEEILKLSGLNKEERQEFLDCPSYQEQRIYLDNKRKKLLDNVHKQEKQITNLDYLKYKMEKEKQ